MGTPAATGEKALLGLYTAGVVAAEVLLVYVSFLAGLAFHAVLVFSALTAYAMASRRVETGASEGLRPATRALAAASFVPLTRVLSAGAPLKGISSVFITGVVVVPVALAAILAARAMRAQQSRSRSKSKARSLPIQLLVGLSGAVVGVAGLFAVRPSPATGAGGAIALGLSVGIIAVAGVAEEIVFRGVVQGALDKVVGAASVGWAGFLFATLYLGSRPLLLLPFMAAAGLYFGWCARRTGSIIGVCVAHGLSNAVFLLGPVVQI